MDLGLARERSQTGERLMLSATDQRSGETGNLGGADAVDLSYSCSRTCLINWTAEFPPCAKAFCTTGFTRSNSASAMIFKPSRIEKRIVSWSVISSAAAVAFRSFNRDVDMRMGIGFELTKKPLRASSSLIS